VTFTLIDLDEQELARLAQWFDWLGALASGPDYVLAGRLGLISPGVAEQLRNVAGTDEAVAAAIRRGKR
jgi:hypothetical protein